MKLNITATARTDGIWLTMLAMVVGLVAIVVTGLTSTTAHEVVTPLLLIAGAMHVSFLVLGSARWIAASSAPMLATFVLESGFGDEPSWVRSIVLGVWWFVAMELAWESIDRRRGARYTQAATMRRVQEVITVVVIALAIGLIAAVSATSLAPVRSVAVQAAVLAGLLAAFVSVVRLVVAGQVKPDQ